MLDRLNAEADIENVASNIVLEKCGFTHEGRIRNGKMGNRYCTYNVYGYIRDDFNQSANGQHAQLIEMYDIFSRFLADLSGTGFNRSLKEGYNLQYVGTKTIETTRLTFGIRWWNQGYSSEAARAVIDYMFRNTDVERIDGFSAVKICFKKSDGKGWNAL